jgi:ATP-dependent RNA helicase SUPV3L1/SUV3
MMADPVRGFAWTRALLGLRADEIHLCGDPSVLSIVRKICADTGDDLVLHQYERFKPLVVEENTVCGYFQNIHSGDWVVVFSRKKIFELKWKIEMSTNHKCCVIYGALPPETRQHQADTTTGNLCTGGPVSLYTDGSRNRLWCNDCDVKQHHRRSIKNRL